ncbi:galactose ABC transporter substrate-binding protein [Enterococcus asini]|uniref:galactose ABC transporter substrate-binding protein n=1 Tax=Enterococcus asini TaxID=57732 RepID=UPI00288CB3D6|nr:galactose ABC transporter substrate-binding protein [Enterococcus asini]MDT2758023.1 galactose ABC transporter substrate-binding protein [Enterococcus asini]
MGIARYDKNDTFIDALTSCVKEEVKKIGAEKDVETMVTIKAASDSQRQQNTQVKELLAAGCNVLCVNLVDRTDPSEIIEQAKEKNVPVIFFNREPVKEDLAQWEKLYYVGGDAQESGVLQGELAAETILENPNIDRNEDGKIQYVVLEGEPGHQDAIIRTEEAVETLKASGVQLEKLGYGIANWGRAQAENRMIQLINQHQNKIELVLSNNDDMALGGLDAYTKLNRTESSIPVFFGIDGTTTGLEAVREGKLAGTVYNDKEAQAKMIAKLAATLSLADDKEIQQLPQQNYAPYAKVTPENVEEY